MTSAHADLVGEVTYWTKHQGGRRDHSGGEVPEGPPALSAVQRIPAIDRSGDVADALELAWPFHTCGPGARPRTAPQVDYMVVDEHFPVEAVDRGVERRAVEPQINAPVLGMRVEEAEDVADLG